MLDRLIGDLRTFCGGEAIRLLAPPANIFRARAAKSRDEARRWFEAQSSVHIGTPIRPHPNRMNTSGTPSFYGALREHIAVAEIQPLIGSHVVVGAFVPTRSLAVLDLGALGDPLDYTSLFDPEFDAVADRLTCLRVLDQEISRPLELELADSPAGLAPTQTLAEYVHVVLGLDGLAYRSTQTGRAPSPGQLHGARLGLAERNVVLFGGAAFTAEQTVPEDLMPGLHLLPESVKLVRVTRKRLHYERDPWIHHHRSQAGTDGDTRAKRTGG